MSYRELRLLTENLRMLGYPRIVSMDSFRESNFSLTADLLIWLTEIYEPRAMIPKKIDTEHDRVALIKFVANTFLTKQHIRLNTKRLYLADGYAVKELLKLISILVEAIQTPPIDGNKLGHSLEGTISHATIKELRERVANMSRSGANLYEALNAEVRLRGSRQQILAKHMELSTIEKALKEAAAAADKVSDSATKKVNSVTGDEATVQAKIDKKKSEIERAEKRLRQMMQLRPAYQDELDEIQADLKILYDEYVVKFRNAVYLESLYEEQKLAEEAEEDSGLINTEISSHEPIGLEAPGLEHFDEEDEISIESDDDILLDKKFYRNKSSENDEDESNDDDEDDDDEDMSGDDDDSISDHMMEPGFDDDDF
ncbi:Oidioi.mRNA.OKI2018_I69.XSR.g16029.t1.cds [Oikopleura dioica]|uniref:Oidioi.mRNA.OKI2018_I69.XSR.g16029.t1.cds n=1 Tax=Oikopleura dioica TaxID=34765 RepID=A0ABN7SJV5_OIKDI|nr:Oidioi.mRNA.OKI2018_I69.XSR.g16029.t1.cds [Oikopleura dioica]